jgi:GTP cyclohydrolase I
MTQLPQHVRRMVDEIERDAAVDTAGPVAAAVRRILEEIGEDPDRPGLLGTPDRVHRMYTELTAGYHVDPERLLNGAIFDIDYSEMVVVREIPFHSLCEHHLLPFFGLSKIPRIVEMYARRLQIQERLTQQVADFLMERLAPKGVGIVLEATHLCAVMRGVRKPGTIMTTSAVLGIFRSNDKTRAEFFAHLARPAPRAP